MRVGHQEVAGKRVLLAEIHEVAGVDVTHPMSWIRRHAPACLETRVRHGVYVSHFMAFATPDDIGLRAVNRDVMVSVVIRVAECSAPTPMVVYLEPITHIAHGRPPSSTCECSRGE